MVLDGTLWIAASSSFVPSQHVESKSTARVIRKKPLLCRRKWESIALAWRLNDDLSVAGRLTVCAGCVLANTF